MLLTSDTNFDAHYPPAIRAHAFTHFTPVDVARVAAGFLVKNDGDRVLDVGSGAGKFCCVGALTTAGYFTGIERRAALHAAAEAFAQQHDIERVDFLLADVVTADFSAYDAFFLFNPFFENLGLDDPIDDGFVLKRAAYDHYCAFTRAQLTAMPAGTRLATYYSFLDDVPQEAYRPVAESRVEKLRFWERR